MRSMKFTQKSYWVCSQGYFTRGIPAKFLISTPTESFNEAGPQIHILWLVDQDFLPTLRREGPPLEPKKPLAGMLYSEYPLSVVLRKFLEPRAIFHTSLSRDGCDGRRRTDSDRSHALLPSEFSEPPGVVLDGLGLAVGSGDHPNEYDPRQCSTAVPGVRTAGCHPWSSKSCPSTTDWLPLPDTCSLKHRARLCGQPSWETFSHHTVAKDPIDES